MAERQRQGRRGQQQGRMAGLRARLRGAVERVRQGRSNGRQQQQRQGQAPRSLRQRLVERIPYFGSRRSGRLDEGRAARSQGAGNLPPARTSPPRPGAQPNRNAGPIGGGTFPGGQHGSTTRGMGHGNERRGGRSGRGES